MTAPHRDDQKEKINGEARLFPSLHSLKGRAGRHTPSARPKSTRVTTHLGYFDRHWRTARISMFHITLQVDVQKLEHKIELLVRMHDVQQPARVRVCMIMRERVRQTYLTMLSSLSSFNRLISRMAVLGTPSSSASSRIFLSATIWLVVTSLALYTTPYVPAGARHQRGDRERERETHLRLQGVRATHEGHHY